MVAILCHGGHITPWWPYHAMVALLCHPMISWWPYRAMVAISHLGGHIMPWWPYHAMVALLCHPMMSWWPYHAVTVALRRRGGRAVAPLAAGCHPLVPVAGVEQLYLGLPRGGEQLPAGRGGLVALARRWHRSLRALDVAGRDLSPQELALALATFGATSPLRSLNLAATKVTPEALSPLLACPHLGFLNLSSCRHLPRGTKRPHQGHQEVQRCLSLTSTRSPSQGAT
uniref:Uncharacterized protein n=1 Tax=Calidris pygmaea TaxID=425635 RepID=A0A8C3KD39_9CHAR